MAPPELDERTLLRYLDGEAGEEVARHLEQCPYCRERARSLERLQTSLLARLYRAECPSPLDLGEYHLRLLPQSRAEAVSRHLAGCPHCSREVVRLQGYLADLAPDLSVSAVQRVKVFVARLLSPGGAGAWPAGAALAPAYAGVRGEAAGPRLYQAGDVEVAITVQRDSRQPDRAMLLGLITGGEARAWQAHLWRGKERVAEVSVDDLGNFVIPGLAPSLYHLILSAPDTEIHVGELHLSGER